MALPLPPPTPPSPRALRIRAWVVRVGALASLLLLAVVIAGNFDEQLLPEPSVGEAIFETVVLGLAFIFWGFMWVAYFRSDSHGRSVTCRLLLLTGPTFGALAYYWFVRLPTNRRTRQITR